MVNTHSPSSFHRCVPHIQTHYRGFVWRTGCCIECLDLNSTCGLCVPGLTAVLTLQTSPSSLPSWRLLTTDPSQLREEDLPGDLQSLSWLTSVDVPRLQQMADSRGHSNGPSQGSLLEQQTGKVTGRGQCNIQNLIKLSDWIDQGYWILLVRCFLCKVIEDPLKRSRLLWCHWGLPIYKSTNTEIVHLRDYNVLIPMVIRSKLSVFPQPCINLLTKQDQTLCQSKVVVFFCKGL